MQEDTQRAAGGSCLRLSSVCRCRHGARSALRGTDPVAVVVGAADTLLQYESHMEANRFY